MFLFLSLWATYTFFIPSPQMDNANQISRMALVFSIAESGSLSIEKLADFTLDKALYGGRYYSDKAPGTSFTALPFVAASLASFNALGLDTVPIVEGRVSRSFAKFTCVAIVFTSSLFTAAAAAMLYHLARHWNATRNAALFAALCFGVATPAAGWATVFFGHALAGACLFLAFTVISLGAALRLQAPGENVLAFVTGVLLAWAVVVEFTVAPTSFAIGAYGFFLALAKPAKRRRTVITMALAGGVLGLLPLLTYNSVAFGSPFHVGYSSVVGFEGEGMKQGFMGVSVPRPGVLYELLFGARRGIVWIAPILLLWPIACWASWRPLPTAAIAVLIFVPVAFLLINAGYVYWDGGWSTGPRHVTPALAFACLPLAFLWMQAGRAGRAAMLAVAGVSGSVTLICVSVDMMSPSDYANPLLEYLVPNFLAGYIHNALTMAWYVRGNEYQPGRWPGLNAWYGLGSLAVVPTIWLVFGLLVAQWPRLTGRLSRQQLTTR